MEWPGVGAGWRWRKQVSLLAGQVADTLELGGTEERRIKYCSQISGLSN